MRQLHHRLNVQRDLGEFTVDRCHPEATVHAQSGVVDEGADRNASRSFRRATATTGIPIAASRRLNSAPMPLLAPVTSADLPEARSSDQGSIHGPYAPKREQCSTVPVVARSTCNSDPANSPCSGRPPPPAVVT